jgi:preprotein translocase subunit SecG
MTILFLILIILSSVLLGLIVLIQNPKGGGLADNIGGLSNQFMGVKQTTDVLEKGTWIFAAVVGLLCIFSSLFIGGSGNAENEFIKGVNTTQPATTPSQPVQQPTQQQPATPAPQPVQPSGK